jgi:arsenate reductase (thioredoxin)
MKYKILFICVHNSARSQMAEAFVNQLCGDEFEAQSAGLEPGKVNPIVVEALQEVGIDISGKPTQGVSELIGSGEQFSHVVTVCSEAEAEGCPYFPGVVQRLHWPFPDPSKLTGSHDEKLARVREIRGQIQRKVEAFCEEQCAVSA